MKNTQQSKTYIEAALRSLPSLGFGDARNFLVAALNQIDYTERKQERTREEPIVPKYHLQTYNMTSKECRMAISGLDRLIQQEQNKLEIPEPNEKPDENISTILG